MRTEDLHRYLDSRDHPPRRRRGRLTSGTGTLRARDEPPSAVGFARSKNHRLHGQKLRDTVHIIRTDRAPGGNDAGTGCCAQRDEFAVTLGRRGPSAQRPQGDDHRRGTRRRPARLQAEPPTPWRIDLSAGRVNRCHTSPPIVRRWDVPATPDLLSRSSGTVNRVEAVVLRREDTSLYRNHPTSAYFRSRGPPRGRGARGRRRGMSSRSTRRVGRASPPQDRTGIHTGRSRHDRPPHRALFYQASTSSLDGPLAAGRPAEELSGPALAAATAGASGTRPCRSTVAHSPMRRDTTSARGSSPAAPIAVRAGPPRRDLAEAEAAARQEVVVAGLEGQGRIATWLLIVACAARSMGATRGPGRERHRHAHPPRSPRPARNARDNRTSSRAQSQGRTGRAYLVIRVEFADWTATLYSPAASWLGCRGSPDVVSSRACGRDVEATARRARAPLGRSFGLRFRCCPRSTRSARGSVAGVGRESASRISTRSSSRAGRRDPSRSATFCGHLAVARPGPYLAIEGDCATLPERCRAKGFWLRTSEALAAWVKRWTYHHVRQGRRTTPSFRSRHLLVGTGGGDELLRDIVRPSARPSLDARRMIRPTRPWTSRRVCSDVSKPLSHSRSGHPVTGKRGSSRIGRPGPASTTRATGSRASRAIGRRPPS